MPPATLFLCVSPNPAIDKRARLDSLAPGRTHRIRNLEAHAGGKAAHVAMVLKALGRDVSWLGFIGGEAGRSVVSGLQRLGIDARVVGIAQNTRVNLELVEDDGRVTEILEPGPIVSSAEHEQFVTECRFAFSQYCEGLSVIFSGSLPQGVPSDLYARLIALAHQFRCRTFLDTSGESLRLGLNARPFFVKPNRDEAEHLFDTRIDSVSAATNAVRRLLDLGAGSAALSMGKDGLLYGSPDRTEFFFAPALPLPVKSAVGSGDSALAGFASAIAGAETTGDALRLAAACAAANCIADAPGAVAPLNVLKFRQQIEVQLVSSVA